jgi:hypothetical protein
MLFVPLGLDLEGDFNFGLGALEVSSLFTTSSFSAQISQVLSTRSQN